MSEEKKRSGIGKNLNRRSVLRKVGTTGILAAGIPQVAAASDGSVRDRELLTGDEKEKLAHELAQTDEFQQLSEKARADGARVRGDNSGINAGRTEQDDFAREVVEYKLADVQVADEGSIVVGRHPNTGEVELAVLDYVHETSDGFLNEVQRFDATETSGLSAETTNLDESIVTVDTEVLRRISERAEIESQRSKTVGTDELTPSNTITGCDGCLIVAGQVCSIGCSAAGAFICGLLGISIPIAGVGCVGFVRAVCTAADQVSGCGDQAAEIACDELGIC